MNYYKELTELSRLADTITNHYLESGARIWAKPGRALKANEVTVMISVFHFPEPFAMTELFELAVSSDDTGASLKHLIIAKLAEEKVTNHSEYKFAKLELAFDSIRLRELTYQGGPRAMVMDSQILKPTAYSNKFCVELLSKPEVKTSSNQLLVYFRYFDRATYTLSPIMEFATTEKQDLGDLVQSVADSLGWYNSRHRVYVEC